MCSQNLNTIIPTKGPGNISLFELRVFSSCVDVKDHWFEIERYNGAKAPFFSYDVVESWYKAFSNSDKVCFFCLFSDEECVGLYPLTKSRKYLCTMYATLYDEFFQLSLPLVKKGFEKVFFSSLLDELQQNKVQWDVLKISYLYSHEPQCVLLNRLLAVRSALQVSTIMDTVYCVELTQGFTHYLANALKKRVRKGFHKAVRRLEKEGDVRFVFLEDAEALAQWDLFLQVEASGWKGANGGALHNAGRAAEFYEKLFSVAARKGALLYAGLIFNGETIACSLGVVNESTYYDLKTAHLEAYRRYSPGNVLLVKMLEYLMEHRPELSLSNMLPFSYGYKHRYGHDGYRCFTHTIFNTTLTAQLACVLYRVKMTVIPQVKSAFGAFGKKVVSVLFGSLFS